MAPKITPGELAKLTDTGLEALGLSPSFITDFEPAGQALLPPKSRRTTTKFKKS